MSPAQKIALPWSARSLELRAQIPMDRQDPGGQFVCLVIKRVVILLLCREPARMNSVIAR